ncbi:uncharacterized protein LOC129600687 [Paramacrobiotus metropolitanus]|uniref:uncharacterized protein LOC129600687 n=1 Tax=Paramacrobiotus metropolitanus TaxID=2943436 RepID=UPI0024460951|nr:uncharacterized protein LOC129600687 [Paramacrobiotus metropolitanus]
MLSACSAAARGAGTRSRAIANGLSRITAYSSHLDRCCTAAHRRVAVPGQSGRLFRHWTTVGTISHQPFSRPASRTVGGVRCVSGPSAPDALTIPPINPSSVMQEVGQLKAKLGSLDRQPIAGWLATSVDEMDDTVIALSRAVQCGDHRQVHLMLCKLSYRSRELSRRDLMQAATVCLLILFDYRCRVKVLWASGTAPGDLAPGALEALQNRRYDDTDLALDLARYLAYILSDMFPPPLRREVKHLLMPLVGRMYWPVPEGQSVTVQSQVINFLSMADLMMLAAVYLLAGFVTDIESVEVSPLPGLIHELNAVAALTSTNRFPSHVYFALGRHSDYPASDWAYYTAKYRGSCRLMVHCHWVYAVARLGSPVHSGAAAALSGALACVDGAVPLLSGALDVADRLGDGTVYPLRSELHLRFLSAMATPVVCRVSYRHESLLQQLMQASDILGPTTSVQYCIAVNVSPRDGDDEPFWATLYLFRRVASPRATPPEETARTSTVAGTERSRGLEVDGVPLCSADVAAMSREDLRRVFDMDLVVQHHADASNYTQPLQLPLELQYPDGSSRPFAVDLDNFFQLLQRDWEAAAELRQQSVNSRLIERDSDIRT